MTDQSPIVLPFHSNDPLGNPVIMSLEQYAAHVGKSARTIKRWLAEEALPGAALVDGKWAIPADARYTQAPKQMVVQKVIGNPTSSTELTAWNQAGHDTGHDTGHVPVEHQLNQYRAYVPLKDAAELLGLSAARMRANPDKYQVTSDGPHGSLVVPQRVIRDALGISH